MGVRKEPEATGAGQAPGRRASRIQHWLLTPRLADKVVVASPGRCRYWLRVMQQDVFNGALPPLRSVSHQLESPNWIAACQRWATDDRVHYWDLFITSKPMPMSLLLNILAHEAVHAQQESTTAPFHGAAFFAWSGVLAEHGLVLEEQYEWPASLPD